MNFKLILVFLSITVFVPSYAKDVTTDDIRALRHELFVNRNYDKYARPIPKKDILRVDIQYSLVHMRDFDVKTQTVIAEGWIWYQWHDESLTWNSTEWRHISALRVPPSEVYLPDIMPYNEIDHTTKKMVDTKAIVYQSGLILWVPPVTTRALCKVNLKRWPYDEHICYLKFGSWTHDGYIMDVKYLNVTSKTILSDMWQNSEFDIKFLNVTNKVTYYDCCKEPYPSVIFYFKLQRKPTLYHYLISVPALVAIISSLATFWLPIRSKIRFVSNGISLLTLTLILLHLSNELGIGGLAVPIAVRFLSLATLFIGIIQIWFTIGYNVSQLNCPIPMWTMRLTKPLLKNYRNTEQESIHLTQTDQSTDGNKKCLQPTTEVLTYFIDKLVFIGFSLTLAIYTFAIHS
jgi:hypothetical protein